MSSRWKRVLRGYLARSRLALVPVVVRGGIAKGARWTLFPYTSYWRGVGEQDVASAISRLGIRQGENCWDLGAHFGIYTVGLARRVGPSGIVASFEPDPVAHSRCARHVEMNALKNVRLFRAGAGDIAVQGTLIVSAGLGEPQSHLRFDDEPAPAGERTIPIPLVRLDSLVEVGTIPRPRFIKIDIEGYGAKALSGARNTIKDSQPAIVMSFHSLPELNGSREVLEPLGYRVFDLTGEESCWEQAIFETRLLLPSAWKSSALDERRTR